MTAAAPPVASIWADLVDTETLRGLASSGFSRRAGVGRRLAALVIDAQNYMVGPSGPSDVLYPAACIPEGRVALRCARHVLEAARSVGAPVFYTRFVLERDGSDIGAYGRKRQLQQTDGWCLEGTVGADIAAEVQPGPDDIVMVKPKPSAFHGTPLTGLLIDRQVDTLIVMGGSTSNCVRATVVDAVSYNFRVIVPADCVFDRVEISHRVALADLDRQYADVVWAEDAVQYLLSMKRDMP